MFSRRFKAQETQTSEKEEIQDCDKQDDIPEQAPNASNVSMTPSDERSQQMNPLTDYKFGIAERLVETVAAKSVHMQKRSPDLVPLSKQFDAMRKRLRQMIYTAKRYHESMNILDKDRMRVRWCAVGH